jgi:hypothetical protein
MLHGNVSPLAQPQYDRGQVSDSLPASRVLLMLNRPPVGHAKQNSPEPKSHVTRAYAQEKRGIFVLLENFSEKSGEQQNTREEGPGALPALLPPGRKSTARQNRLVDRVRDAHVVGAREKEKSRRCCLRHPPRLAQKNVLAPLHPPRGVI